MTPWRRPGPVVTAMLLASAFGVVAALVELTDNGVDSAVLSGLHHLIGRTGQDALVTVDHLSDLPGLAVVAAAFSLGLLLARRRREAVLFVVGVAGVWLVNPVVKELFQRPRPGLWASPVSTSELGFPSGHAANTAALVVALVLALPAGRWRTRAALVGAAALITVAFSQLALGVHFPSDIVAGWLLAGAWLAVVRAVGQAALTPSAATAASGRRTWARRR